MIEKEVLQKWNNAHIRYCVLRNYTHLLIGYGHAYDLDISIHHEDYKEAETILLDHGFLKKTKQFDHAHQGYVYITKDMQKIGFDIQKGGVYWNNMRYLDQHMFKQRKKQGSIFTLSDTDAYVMYLCHSILGKRYMKAEYKKAIEKLTIHKQKVIPILSEIFSPSWARWLIQKVTEKKWEDILGKKYRLIFCFIMKKGRGMKLFPLFFRWLYEKKIRSYPILACIGPDGSGKTTITREIRKVLRKRNIPVEIIYFGRGKKNILPVKKAGSIFKKREQHTNIFLKKCIYSAAAPVYTIDLMLRYISIARKRRTRIVLTDRYGTDILIIPYTPLWLKKFFFNLFPTPSIALYLHAHPEDLYKRKQQQSPKELARQMKLFTFAAQELHALSIKSSTMSKKQIVRIAIRELARKGFY